MKTVLSVALLGLAAGALLGDVVLIILGSASLSLLVVDCLGKRFELAIIEA
ncbi:hypothetical protein [Pseudomonas chlororaphis]|uniref:Uncharacterized protein n=1 Tax=Pseudomonas chlororaphis subsp. aurantiaca TaxID=86192 RepID=A0AAJ0ZK50_9PSED|nr:hypothetical protein [Pseudomonas chlororaphis]MBU4633474.1 hypothetical protein [Pseudomonas chlororaphis subsp. aurantiaca]